MTRAISSLMTACGVSLFASCAPSSGEKVYSEHVEVSIVDAGVSAASAGSVNSLGLNIGPIYLEQQAAPPVISGLSVQASDVSVKDGNIYVSYSYRDPSGNVKAGGIQQVKPAVCDSILTAYTDFCLAAGGLLTFANSNIFSTASDGTYLYAVGSTTDESTAPYFGRLFKIGLNGSGAPTAVSTTATLPSYTGTSVAVQGTKVLATYGTAATGPMMGGFRAFDAATLNTLATQPLFDARDIKVDPTNSARSFVVTGATNASSLGKTIEFNSDASGSALRTLNTGGNSIPESRSSVLVGNSLLISSAGDAGFTVMCKATGAVLAQKAAPSVSGISAANTVTNGFAAVPGFLLVANGEAGVYIYQFAKSSLLNSNYCQGVTLTLLGRLTLASGTYVNAELSANSIKTVTLLNVLNVVSTRLIVIASGNKGISLLNVTNLSLALDAVDDF